MHSFDPTAIDPLHANRNTDLRWRAPREVAEGGLASACEG